MSVLVKGFKVPKNCGDCRFCAGLADTEWGTCAGCLIDDEYREASSKSGCPLVEVPAPHGRLIDADALLEDVRKNSVSYSADDFAHEWVDVQPTVIEAEGRTDATN